ncbi:prolyl 4-hydroxylase subunit alpha-3-like [Babylonia areolata]|uniref:prolyl 4-hydroxylase subunit alpha-3-like n=1 Tax=Babylonia areolata TaxID=304850 RepID=UPI003FD0064C
MELWKLAHVLVIVGAVVVGPRWGARGEGSDLHLSTAETTLLLESEPLLLGFVHRCLTQTARNTGNAEFSRLARELQTDLSSLPLTQDARHPLDAFVGLRRFTEYWAKYITRLDPVVARSVRKSLQKSHIEYPDHSVLRQAGRAIVRLQASYHLPPTALLASATSNLTGADLASLVVEAEGLGFPSLAEGWRRLGLSLFPSSEFPLHVSLGKRSLSQNDNDEITETHIIQRKHAKFFSLCQHFLNSTDISALRSQRCEYRAGAVPVSRWKTEVLSTDPPVVLYYEFVSEREAAMIVSKAMSKLEQAHTGPTLDDSYLRVQRRLGKMAWLRDVSSGALSRVSRRIQDVTGLHAVFRPFRSFGEDFQVVNYGIGGHYIPHCDYFRARDAFVEAEPYLRDSGDRAATFMIYLGDVSQGGATVFPDLGIGAPPVKRAALFWYNFSPDGLPDRRSLHGGCPVLIGQKWVANKWIHEISTAMTHSCRTTPRTRGNT